MSEEASALGWSAIEALERGGFFEGLTHLWLPGNAMGQGALDSSTETLFARLEELDLSFNYLRDVGARALLSRLDGSALHTLSLAQNQLNEQVWLALMELETSHLRRLNLAHNRMGDRGARACLEFQRLSGLMHLDLGYNDIPSSGFEGGFEALSSLRSLGLAGNPMGDDGLYYLTRGEGFEGLERVDLSTTRCGVRGARALATSLHPRLTSLDLSSNGIGDDGAKALAHAPLTSLERLDLSGCEIGDEGATALARAPWGEGLLEMDLARNPISERGRGALFGSETLPLHIRARFAPLE